MSDRKTRTYRAKENVYQKALRRRSKKPLVEIIEDVVTCRAKGFSIIAKKGKETIEIVD